MSVENKKEEPAMATNNEALAKEQAPKKVSLPFIVSGRYLYEMAIKEVPCLLEPLIPKIGVVAFTGSSDTGKSCFLKQLAVAIVKGDSEFIGFPLHAEHKRVVYISTEDFSNDVAVVLRKQNPTHSGEEIERLGFIFDTDGIEKKLEMTLQKHKVDCVILDAFSDLFSDDLNSAIKVRQYLKKFSQLAMKHQCLIIFLHHTGKRTEQLQPSKNNILGSQGFEAKMRLVLELRRDPLDGRIRHLCVVKGNYLSQEYKSRSYKLLFDENLCFHYLGERVSFGDLSTCNRPSNSEKKLRAIELKAEGLSIRQIVDKMIQEGLQVSKSSISEWTKKPDDDSKIDNEPSPDFSSYFNDEDCMGHTEDDEDN